VVLGARDKGEVVERRREGVMYRYGSGLGDWKNVSRSSVIKGFGILMLIIDVQCLYSTTHGH